MNSADNNPTKRLSNVKMRRNSDKQQEEEDAAFELAAAAAEAREERSSLSSSTSTPSSADTTSSSNPDDDAPKRGRGRGRLASDKENKPLETKQPNKSRSKSPATRSRSSGDELEKMAAMLRNRHSTGSSAPARGLSPRRAPRRVKSERRLKTTYEPAHRSLSPCRSCLSSSSSLASMGGAENQKRRFQKKGIRRNVSFGNKCYDEIPKAEEDEKTSIWYDKSELKGMRKEVKKLAKKKPQDELFANKEEAYRGLEPYVEMYQKRKSGDIDALTDKQQCNQILLELTEIDSSNKSQESSDQRNHRSSEELTRMAKEFLHRFAEQGARAAAEDEAEARAIYLESGIDAEQVSKCFKQQQFQQQQQQQQQQQSQPQQPQLEQTTASAVITLGPRGA